MQTIQSSFPAWSLNSKTNFRPSTLVQVSQDQRQVDLDYLAPTNMPSLFTSHLSQTLQFRHSFLLPVTISTDLINVSNNTLILKPKSVIPTWLFMSVCLDLCIHSVTCQYIFSCNFRDIRIPCFSIPISNIPFTVLC